MRVRKEQLVVTFPSTTAAMAMERFAKEEEIPGRIIPLPSELSAGCGLAWKTEPEEKAELMRRLDQAGIRWELMAVLKL